MSLHLFHHHYYYTVSQKRETLYTLVHIFAKYWPIFTISHISSVSESLLIILLQISYWMCRRKNYENRSIFSTRYGQGYSVSLFWLTVYISYYSRRRSRSKSRRREFSALHARNRTWRAYVVTKIVSGRRNVTRILAINELPIWYERLALLRLIAQFRSCDN